MIDVELDPSVKFKKKHQGLVYGKESYMWEVGVSVVVPLGGGCVGSTIGRWVCQ